MLAFGIGGNKDLIGIATSTIVFTGMECLNCTRGVSSTTTGGKDFMLCCKTGGNAALRKSVSNLSGRSSLWSAPRFVEQCDCSKHRKGHCGIGVVANCGIP